MTKKAANLENTKIDPNHGSNPGEFGSGFYLTTGHATEPQERVSQKWGEGTPGNMVYPKEIVNFRIANSNLRKLVGDDDAQLAFLIHMLQTSSGYPGSGAEAIDMMNRINVKGRVLIFPDAKNVAVKITAKESKTWEQFTEHNSGGGTNHALVIGPNRPADLDGIRQVAVRGELGQLFINIAKRSQQKIPG